jgi:outer membrane protein OmpA-like peptidoglycan-associated protein
MGTQPTDGRQARSHPGKEMAMSINLIEMLSGSIGKEVIGQASKFLGESEASTGSAVGSLLPALLGSMSQKASTTSGAADLFKMVTGSNIDTGLLGSLGGLLSGGEKTNALLSLGGTLASSLFGGDKVGGIAKALASLAGIKPSSATSLLTMVLPLGLSFVKKHILDNKMDAGGLAGLLRDQKVHLDRIGIDKGLASAIGLAPAAAAAVRPEPAPARKSGLGRLLPWIIGAIALLSLLKFMNKPTPPPPPPPPPVSAPAPVVATLPASVYFETAKFDLDAEAMAKISAAAQAIKKDNLKIEITGYTDKRGDLAANEKLAKERAVAVKNALVAAGVAESSVTMAKPFFVEAGAPGADADARRVDIKKSGM